MIEHSRPVSAKTLLLLILMSLYTGLSGCGQQVASRPAAGVGVEVSGVLPAGRTGSLLFEQEETGIRVTVPVDGGGRFSSRLPAGRYRILLQQADGRLTLVRRGVTLEDNLTISLLDVDLVPIPTVTSVAVPQVGATDAIIEWETDIESEGRIDFGFSAAYGQSTYTDTRLSRRHRIQLLGLLPATAYHFRIVSTRHGLEEVETFSQDYVFTTEAPPPPPAD